MKKARELKDITLAEVSLVNKAANKKKFLFFKQEGKPAKPKKLKKKINIVIDSDGTIGGTKIAVNKEEIKDLRDFSFSFYSIEGDSSRAISCSYSKFVETEDGFSRSETFYLSKGDVSMDKKIKEQLEKYFGEDSEIDFEKAEDSDAIAKALETVNEYREDFPDDLKEAVGTIAKQAGFCNIIVTKMLEKEKDNKTEGIEKAGAKLSKDTLKKIQEALVTLKSILPALKEVSTEKSEVEKMVEGIQESIEKLEEKKKKGETKDVSTELTKTLKELAKRLEVVEEGTGIKKSLTDQENDGETTSDGKKWPSLSGG